MLVDVKDMDGKVVGEIDLRDDIFGIEPNVSVMHQAFVRQQANARQGTHKSKTRSEVRGTTAKWYRQKGTGRARHGDRKAPIFVGGGKAHGPLPRDYSKKMPRKMRRLALRSALSVKTASQEVVVLRDISVDQPKTVNVVRFLQNLGITGSVVILLPERNELLEKSARNLPHVKTLRATYLNVRDLLGYDYILTSQDSVSVIEKFLG
jgi:large subunit ribosomal protein L4